MLQGSSAQQSTDVHQQSMPSLPQPTAQQQQQQQQQQAPSQEQEKQGLELIKSWFTKNGNTSATQQQQQQASGVKQSGGSYVSTSGEAATGQYPQKKYANPQYAVMPTPPAWATVGGLKTLPPQKQQYPAPTNGTSQQYYEAQQQQMLKSGGPSLPHLSSLPNSSQQFVAYPMMPPGYPPQQYLQQGGPYPNGTGGLRSVPSVPANHLRTLGTSQSAAVMPSSGHFSQSVGSAQTVFGPTQFGGQFNSSWNPQMAFQAQQHPVASTYYNQTRTTVPYQGMALQPNPPLAAGTANVPSGHPPVSYSQQTVTTQAMKTSTKNQTEAAETGLTFLIQKLADIDSNSEEIFQKLISERRSFAGDVNKTKNMILQQLNNVQYNTSGSMATTAGRPSASTSNAYNAYQSRASYLPFNWESGDEYENEFSIEGTEKNIVRKVGDFEDEGWVIPVAGSLKMNVGGVYRWSLKLTNKSVERPQLQFGVHGENHAKPWRLITTSRCSTSSDDEPWIDRVEGDRVIHQGDVIHVEVDLRGILPTPQGPPKEGEETNTEEASKPSNKKMGVIRYALNDENWEVAFADLDLATLDAPIIPIVSMGGHGCCVEIVSA